MSWNYRVMRRRGRHPKFGKWETYGIHEVYAEPGGWTIEPRQMVSDDVEGLKWSLRRMLEALEKPILDYDTGRPVRAAKSARTPIRNTRRAPAAPRRK